MKDILEPAATRVASRSAERAGSATTGYIQQVFGKDAARAIKVASKESDLRCNFMSPDGRYGLFGITRRNHHLFEGESMTDCEKNVDVAKQLVDQYGWGIFE